MRLLRFTRRKRVVVAPPDPRRAARRLRAMGVMVLVAGLGGAVFFYWIRTTRREPTLDELMPGYAAASARQTGLLYGHGVQSILDLYHDLTEPAPEAGMLAGIAVFAAVACFRAARLRDSSERITSMGTGTE